MPTLGTQGASWDGMSHRVVAKVNASLRDARGRNSVVTPSPAPATSYPVLKTQCAWCLRYTVNDAPERSSASGHVKVVNGVTYVLYASRWHRRVKDLDASHGICTECTAVVLAEVGR